MKERIELETEFSTIVVVAKEDEHQEFLARHALHQLLKWYKREHGSVEDVLRELQGYHGANNKTYSNTPEPFLSLADFEDRYQAIMRTEPGYEQNKALSGLMDLVKREFDVPLLRNEEWEHEHPAIIAMYRKIANSRASDTEE